MAEGRERYAGRMRTSLVAPWLGAAVALAACSDPELTVTIVHDDPALEARLASMTVSVIELPANDDGTAVTCDQVRYGRISRDRLDGGRRASTAAGGRLTGVPRLGDKLVLLEGRDVDRARIAGGCEPLHAIEADTDVAIHAELAPRLRLVGLGGQARDPSQPPGDFEVAVFAPPVDGAPPVGLAGQVLEVDVRDRKADRAAARPARFTSCGTAAAPCPRIDSVGLTTIAVADVVAGLAPPIRPGPVEIDVRAPWADEPLVVPAFEPLPLLAQQALAPSGLGRTPNQAAPSWAVLRGPAVIHAAAIYVVGDPAPEYRVIVLDIALDPLALVRHELLVDEPIYSLVAWNGKFWTRTARGWRSIDPTSPVLSPPSNDPGEAATELIAIEKCDPSGPEGLLVRARTGGYVAFDRPGQPHLQPLDDLGKLTRLINVITPGRIATTLCLTYPNLGTRRAVVVRGVDSDQMSNEAAATFLVRANPPDRALAPVTAGFLGYPDHVDDSGQPVAPWRLAGAVAGVTGPRLASYTLTTFLALGGDDGRLAGELATLPIATDLGDLDGDGAIDVVTTSHEILDQSRIQITYPAVDGRAALTGLSPAVRGTAPLVLLGHDSRTSQDVVTVATSDLIAMFDLGGS